MIKKYLHWHYFILLLLLLFLSFLFFSLPLYRLYTATAIGLTYFVWGIVHHWLEKTLFISIVIEYFAVGLLATAILIFISLRA